MTTKIKASNIETGAVTADKIASGAIASSLGFTPANNSSLATVATTGSYNDLTNKPTIPTPTPTAVSDQANTSTGYFDVPAGTTAQRPVSPNVGMVRYNTDIGFLEQYTGDGWQGIAPPPAITSVSPTTYNGEQGTSFTINGSNFDSGVTLKFITSQGTEYAAATLTRVSNSQLTATTPQDFTVANEPLKVKVVNGSGLAYVLDNAIDCGSTPTWSTSAGSLGTCYDIMRTGYYVDAIATDPDAGSTISYSLVSGALPTGMSLNSSTGRISGTPSSVGGDTTSSFTLRATDNAGNTNDRAFSITIKAPITTTYTYTGSTVTWTPPSGVTKLYARLWGSGGGHGECAANSAYAGGGGYAEGYINSITGNLYLQVGEAGVGTGGSGNGGGNSGRGGWPNGGNGANADTCDGGGGGGSTNIYDERGTGSISYLLLVAGSGGGVSHGNTYNAGGDGGGQTGGNAVGNSTAGGGSWNGPGTTTGSGGAGGAASCGSAGNAGSQMQGGNAPTGNGCTNAAAGGGGGYFGGGSGGTGAGGNSKSGGGGGCGYYNNSRVTSATLSAYNTGNWASGKPSGVAERSAAADGARGGHGAIIIQY